MELLPWPILVIKLRCRFCMTMKKGHPFWLQKVSDLLIFALTKQAMVQKFMRQLAAFTLRTLCTTGQEYLALVATSIHNS